MVTLILLPALSNIILTVTNNKEINIYDVIKENEITTITTVIYNQILRNIRTLLVRTGERRDAYSVLLGKPEGKNHLEEPGIEGKIILRWIFRKLDWGMDWIDLALDRDRSRAVVNAVTNLSGSIISGEFLE